MQPYQVPCDVILIRNWHFRNELTTVRNLPSLEPNVTSYELSCNTTQNKYLCRSIDYTNDRVFQRAYNEVQLLKRLSHPTLPRLSQICHDQSKVHFC